METTKDFYENIPAFQNFDEILNGDHYYNIPDDWHVIISDVKGSTIAVEEGRYKDVNTVGAATIVVVQNALPSFEFPYVFGGDGATIIIPSDKLEIVQRSLLGLKHLSENQFGLKLRTASISIREINESGYSIKVAKFKIFGKKTVALFNGGGLTIAEDKIKSNNTKYEFIGSPEGDSNLKGLSCRWQPIPSKKGSVVSILVTATESDSDKTYQHVIEEFNEIFDGQLDTANPVDSSIMSYKSISQCYQEEKRYHPSILSVAFLLRYLEIIVAVLVFKFGLKPLFFDPKAYSESMRVHSDYRKFDDTLRMVVDCTEDQYNKINQYLHSMHQQGKLYYGLHKSENALMTCFVDNIKDGNHIHFVDGDNGGYAIAAKQLKSQMKNAN